MYYITYIRTFGYIHVGYDLHNKHHIQDTSRLKWLTVWLPRRPPTAWTLHPPAATSAPVKVETVEKKIPKGVPLQFDINSVGKPVRARCLGFCLVKYTGRWGLFFKCKRSKILLNKVCWHVPDAFLSTANIDDLERAISHPKGSAHLHITKQ